MYAFDGLRTALRQAPRRLNEDAAGYLEILIAHRASSSCPQAERTRRRVPDDDDDFS
jgi:hypothetical protein